MRRLQNAFGHGEVLPRDGLELAAPLHVRLQLCGGRARLGAHSRPAGQEQRQQRQAVDVSGVDQVAVQHHVGMSRQSSPPEIHQQERKIVQDVRAGDLVVELDAIEEGRRPVQQHDVAQMEIAVALPDEA